MYTPVANTNKNHSFSCWVCILLFSCLLSRITCIRVTRVSIGRAGRPSYTILVTSQSIHERANKDHVTAVKTSTRGSRSVSTRRTPTIFVAGQNRASLVGRNFATCKLRRSARSSVADCILRLFHSILMFSKKNILLLEMYTKSCGFSMNLNLIDLTLLNPLLYDNVSD